MEMKCKVCPWWLGYLLINPIRKYKHNPDTILSMHIKPGMNIMDYGSAMGYFSLPLAKLTGKNGKVYCVDIQKKMLDKLRNRAKKAGVSDIIITCLIGNNFDMRELQDKIDFIMLFAVVHEVPDKEKLFKDLYMVMKPGGKILFAEPKGHVSPESYSKSLKMARSAGFKVIDEEPMKKGLCKFLVK